MEEKGHQKFNSIDLFKFVMALCVVAIHTHPLETCTNQTIVFLYSVFVDMAVPFFFLSSGLLLVYKLRYPYSDPESMTRIRWYLSKTVRLYLIWSVVYLPITIIYYVSKQMSIKESLLQYLQGLVFVGEHFNSWMLWYLLSMTYAIILILILLKIRCRPELITLLGIIGLAVSIGITNIAVYQGPLPRLFRVIRRLLPYTTINGRILLAVFYLPVGILLAKKPLHPAVSVLFFAVGFIMRLNINNYTSNTIATALCSIGFFSLVRKIELPDSPAFFTLRKMSSVIYFLHLMVWTIFYSLKYAKITFGAESFLVTSLICICIAFAYVMIRYRPLHAGQERIQG